MIRVCASSRWLAVLVVPLHLLRRSLRVLKVQEVNAIVAEAGCLVLPSGIVLR
jgi:hypothetical protein